MGKDDSNDSPEKQLLKLIEAQQPQTPAPVQTASIPKEPVARPEISSIARGKGLTLFSWGALQGRWMFFQHGLSGFGTSMGGPLDLKKINSLLTAAAVLMGAYFCLTTVVLALKLKVVPSFSFKIDRAANLEALRKTSQLKSVAFYAEKARSRDIFKLGAQPSGETAAPNAAAIKAKQESLMAKYKLVGISWSDSPDVMLEDIAAKKTFFLKKDQSLDNVKIQAVFKDKVILSQDGIEVELR